VEIYQFWQVLERKTEQPLTPTKVLYKNVR